MIVLFVNEDGSNYLIVTNSPRTSCLSDAPGIPDAPQCKIEPVTVPLGISIWLYSKAITIDPYSLVQLQKSTHPGSRKVRIVPVEKVHCEEVGPHAGTLPVSFVRNVSDHVIAC